MQLQDISTPIIIHFTFFELTFKLSEDSMDQANVTEVLNNSKIVTAQWEWFLIFAEKKTPSSAQRLANIDEVLLPTQ